MVWQIFYRTREEPATFIFSIEDSATLKMEAPSFVTSIDNDLPEYMVSCPQRR
jgi:hypothetical protein